MIKTRFVDGSIENLDRFMCDSKKLIAHYKDKKFLFIREFVDKKTVSSWLQEIEKIPARRVNCHVNPSVTWDEQKLTNNYSVYRFFSSILMQDLMLNLEDVALSKKLKNMISWTCRYKRGEFIDRHKDSSGCIQAILCLKTVDQKNGGSLIIENSNRPVHLNPGDLLILKATSLYHQTTPLLESNDCPDPIRIIAVARYFFT